MENSVTNRPTSRILTAEDLEVFQSSETYNSLLQFILDLREACTGRPNSFPCAVSKNVEQVLDLLEKIETISKQHPAVENEKSRFGNPAFRDFYDDLETQLFTNNLLTTSLSSSDIQSSDGLVDLQTYLLHSFGNRTRIDYGSGHELNFICFLLVLFKLGVFTKDDFPALVLRVFNRYIALMRVLQSVYWLEPAGSHGVWGLDDYHFLPFLFGAAQLSTHKYLRPRSIHDNDVLESYGKEYMYLGAIAFINSVKTASLRWSSPMLDDISGVKTWAKVSEGMVKMYKNEVLGKVPVMQHFLFGKILSVVGELPSERAPRASKEEDTHHEGHVHGEGIWGDCCGIKIPSSIAASQQGHEGQLRTIPGAIKPIPFD
ncbi:Phosphotyrosyl phosphatase activator [Myxozyma melibiosi]|uniref:Serine/threonine-protein phosphatase 2A activator n=1 Tax=Myxozyma melibiosi TaxID=54550 RepID=A0ABR1F3N9_9ASCO